MYQIQYDTKTKGTKIMKNHIIEVVIMQIKNGVSEREFLELSAKFGEALKQEDKVKGFIKRSFTKHLTEDKWIEMIWWENMECAQAALEMVPRTVTFEFQQYCAAIEDSNTKIFYLEEKNETIRQM